MMKETSLNVSLKNPDDSNTPLPQRALPITVLESPEDFTVRADLPGVPRDKIRLEYELGMLFLEAEFSSDTEHEREVLLNENPACRYSRTLKMNADIDSAEIRASMEQGVLQVILPKKPTAKRQQISIC
jgi:HSP20 family protein